METARVKKYNEFTDNRVKETKPKRQEQGSCPKFSMARVRNSPGTKVNSVVASAEKMPAANLQLLLSWLITMRLCPCLFVNPDARTTWRSRARRSRK
jgi:hypothetical protein